MQDIEQCPQGDHAPQTRCIWIETPSNPLLNLVDIKAAGDVAKANGAITIADNTFMSPYCQRPFELGVDVVRPFDDQVPERALRRRRRGRSSPATRSRPNGSATSSTALGLGCSPFDAWLVLRGVKTLVPRMEAHSAGGDGSGQDAARTSAGRTGLLPGAPRPSAPRAGEAADDRASAACSASTSRGDRRKAERVMPARRLFSMAESLGGVESLMEHPETMSHASMTLEARRGAGITDKTLRVSVGIEHPDDLIADMRQALES